MSGEVRIENEWDGITVYITDDETGSRASFGAESREEAWERALVWLGYDLLVGR